MDLLLGGSEVGTVTRFSKADLLYDRWSCATVQLLCLQFDTEICQETNAQRAQLAP